MRYGGGFSGAKGKRLTEIVRVFTRLGLVAFGGPAAHTALLEQELVSKRKWVRRDAFLDMVSFTNLIPGPNSTELVLHLGLHRAGLAGMLLAGLCFLLPAVCITLGFAVFYMRYGQLMQVQAIFAGVLPAIMAIIVLAMYKLGRKAVSSWLQGAYFVGALVLMAIGVGEILSLLAIGLAGLLVHLLFIRKKPPAAPRRAAAPPRKSARLPLLALPLATAASSVAAPTIGGIFWVFLKVGAVLFGSGYVLVAYLDAELVQRLHWLSARQLLDAIAVGQYSPGPVLSTATFVGYVMQGMWGALAATLGIFLPSFVLVALTFPLLRVMRSSALLSAFLNAANAASVALLVWVSISIGSEALTGWLAAGIFVAALLVLLRYPKLSAIWIVTVGAVVGFVAHYLYAV